MDGYYKLIIQKLKEHGYEYDVNAKGSHEKWILKDSKGNKIKSVVVPYSTKSRFSANNVLKQAGIDEKI